MKKILLTGGTGFIGSHIAVSLREAGYVPIIVDNFSNSGREMPSRLNSLTGKKEIVEDIDCRDLAALSKLNDNHGPFFGIIHLAAFKAVGESVENPIKYYDNNIGSMTKVLELAAEKNIPNFVFSSSCTVYGSPDAKEVLESTPFKEAYSPYGVTKQVCERMMKDIADRRRDLNFISLRYFNPIGAHPTGKIGELPLGRPNNLVPYLTQTAAGLREKVTVFGDNYDTADGTCIRDYIHVCDLATAHVAALEYCSKSDNPHYEVFNVGTGRGNSVLEIIRTFKEVNGVDFKVEIGSRRAGDVDAIFANTDKARNHLLWTPKYSLADALKHAWKWQQNLEKQVSS